MSSQKWIDGLKVGDDVCIDGNFSKSIGVVQKITAAQIVLRHFRFRRRDGWAVDGNGFNYRRIIPLTDELRESIERKKAIEYLLNLNRSELDALPTEALQKAAAMLTRKDHA